jgi:hypothetical protein
MIIDYRKNNTNKRTLKGIVKLLIAVLLIFLTVYCTVLRFIYPELTETQLFLKMFGLL